MGRDKALLEFGGLTLVARALGKLDAVCSEVAIAGGGDELKRFGRVVPDRWTGCGPLGGIAAALETSEFEWNMFLPVDVPLVPKELVRALAERCLVSPGAAVIARVKGRAEPLCGGYHRRVLCGVRTALAAGQYKVMTAVEAAGEVDFFEVGVEYAEWFVNVNTPDELDEAARFAQQFEANSRG